MIVQDGQKMHTQLGGEFTKWMIYQYVGRASKNHNGEGSLWKKAYCSSPHKSASWGHSTE